MRLPWDIDGASRAMVLIDSGMSVTEVAKIYDGSRKLIGDCYKHYRKHGVINYHPKTSGKWGVIEAATIKVMHQRGCSEEQIARRLQTTLERVRGGIFRHIFGLAPRNNFKPLEDDTTRGGKMDLKLIWTDEIALSAMRMIDEGLSYRQASAIFGVSNSIIEAEYRDYLKLGMLKPYTNRRRHGLWSLREVEMMKLYFLEGMTPEQIAEKMGQLREPIRKAINKYILNPASESEKRPRQKSKPRNSLGNWEDVNRDDFTKASEELRRRVHALQVKCEVERLREVA